MKLWDLSAVGWKEFADVPSTVSKDNVYAFLSFCDPVCDILPASQAPLTTAMTLNLKTNEIKFQRVAEDVPVIALLCSITE
uniref:Uncharacterized protein n=1 Tax=Panagrolaimus davidi TaxID=227884 RepID=A0A914RCN3_9BILA